MSLYRTTLSVGEGIHAISREGIRMYAGVSPETRELELRYSSDTKISVVDKGFVIGEHASLGVFTIELEDRMTAAGFALRADFDKRVTITKVSNVIRRTA